MIVQKDNDLFKFCYLGAIVLGLLFVHSPLLRAQQGRDNIWIFGSDAGIDFNNGPPVAVAASSINAKEGCASVCNESGQLLFYTEGTNVWDKNNNPMPNGSNLVPAYNNLGITATYSTTQGAVIVPVPEKKGQYYLFSLSENEEGIYAGRLYYSIVNMGLNGGLGDVEPGAKGILIDSGLTEKMTAVTGDECNIWLLVHTARSVSFRAYEITASGINPTPVISNTGTQNASHYGAGVIRFAPGRKKLVTCNVSGGLEVYDFNPATGKVSDPLLLDKAAYYGGCFSPDNSKLYAWSLLDHCIYQFDLSLSSVQAISDSKTQIGPSIPNTNSSDLKLGPDGKVYAGTFNASFLNCIEFPNLAGTACQYTPQAVHLNSGGHFLLGLPNENPAPLWTHDTTYTAQNISAGCFANVNLLTVRANDSTGWNYKWNTGLIGPSFITIDSPGTYWVTYHTSPCNYNADTFHVIFPDGVLPDVYIRNACKGSPNGKAWATTYAGDTVAYHYCWQNNNGDTLSLDDTLQNIPSGDYTLRVNTAHCDTTLSFFIPEEEHHVSFLADSIICQGAEVHFTNTSDRSFTQFLWDFGDQGDSRIRNPGHIYKQSGSYQVTLIGKGKICTDTANKTITVDSLFSGTFLTEPDRICAGREAVSFYPQTDSNALSLHWQFGDGTEMVSDREKKIQHAYETAGSLPVRLTTHFRACPDTSFTDTVYVYDLPKVDLGPDTTLCLNGSPIILQNRQTLPTGTYHYRWNTGDTTGKLKVVHPGIYRLTVSTEPLSCRNTVSIKITKDCYIDIPNAFTPNGDGENDYFFPRQLLTQKVTQFRMQVFNRWGMLLFETSRKDGRGWDGRFNGKSQPEGVYVYLIDAEVDGVRKEHYQGNVTLIR